MANIKISQLTSLSTMTDAAIIPVVDSGVTQQISGANLKTYFTGSYGNANVVANLAALGSNPITTTGNVTGGNISATGTVLGNSVTLNTSANVSVAAGQMAWNSADGTMDIGLGYGNVVLQTGQETHYVVRNETGNVISDGTAVYCSGVTPSGRISVDLMTSNIDPVQFLGLATQDISNGVNGVVTWFGYVRDLDTRGTANTAISVGDETWAVGDKLYVHPTAAGKLTKVEPAAPNAKICVASIITRNQSSGALFVRPTTNLTAADLSDVQITTPATNQFLVYVGNRWENTALDISLDSTPALGGNLAGAGFNISNVGNISVTGNITANNIGNISSINLSGNANTVLYGNGVFAAVTGGGGGDYGNSNVAAFLAAYGSNTVSTTGNITAGNLDAVNLVINRISSDDSSFVTVEDGMNVNGDIAATGNISVTGNIVGSNTIVINNQASGNTADIQLASANSILLQARDRTAGTDPGGAITIQAGSSAANVGAFFNQGGDISINSGSGGESNVDYAGWGGNLFLRGGSGGDSVGASAYAGRGGSVTLLAGSAGDDGGNSAFGDSGGLVAIAAGDTTSTDGVGGPIYLDTGDGGPGGRAGALVISIPPSDQGPGGDWEFYGTGNTMYVPGNSSISQRDYTQNFSVESSGNTIITSNAPSYGNSRTAQNWVFDRAGNLTAPGNVSAAGNITGGNIVTAGNVSAGYFIGNGSQLTGLPAGYSNAEVAAYLPTYTGNVQAGNISVMGNLTSNNINAAGNVTSFTIDTGTVFTNTVNAVSVIATGDISGGSLTTAGPTSTDSLTATATISAAGNVIGNNFNTAGLVSALGNVVTAGYFIGNFQGNITGNLSVAGSNTQVLYNGQGNAAAAAGFTFDSDSNTVAVLGPVSAQGNVTGGNIVTVGNVDAGYFIGNGSQLTGLPEGYANANVAAYLPTYTGNITAANITGNFFIGNGSQLTGLPQSYGNANVAANLAAFGSNPITTTGTVTAQSLSADSVYGNDIYGGNINATGTVSADYSSFGNLFVAYDGTVLGNIAATGNLTAGGFLIGDGGFLSNITAVSNLAVSQLANGTTVLSVASSGGNIDFTVGGVGGVLTVRSNGIAVTGAQSVTGNVTAGNLDAVNLVINRISSDDSSFVTIEDGVNVSGDIAATGNITGGAISFAGGSRLSPLGANLDIFAGTGAYVNLTTSDESSRMGVDNGGGYIVTAGGTWGFSTTGNLSAPGNISAVGNVTAGNISTGSGSITGGNVNGNVFNGNVAFGNGVIGGIGNISGGNISAIGNITGGNISAIGNIVANTIGASTQLSAKYMLFDVVPLNNLTPAFGARAFVNDANRVAAGNFGAQITDGGANTVPVWSDGTNWYIG